jgi:hypothetical protein
MPNENALISSRIQFDPPFEGDPAEALRREGGLSVILADDRRVSLDPTDERSVGFVEILDGLRQLRRPVYLELDPGTNAIARLEVPLVGHVIGLSSTTAGVLDVQLDTSHAVHRLRLDGPDAGDIEATLRQALDTKSLILLVDDVGGDILDLRGFTPGPDDGPLPPFPEPKLPKFPVPILDVIWRILRKLWFWPYWPWWWFWTVSMKRAQGIFDAMRATNCDPLTAAAPCIPFMFPDNGCWARANEMCRLMSAMGEASRKVWITRGVKSLHADTRNHTQCYIEWYWHVAPTIAVRGPWFWQIRRMVIDPSLTTGPVTESGWKAIMQDSTATLEDTDASQYGYGGGTDPTYSQTNYDLQVHRLLLKARSLQPGGPPPYAHCP